MWQNEANVDRYAIEFAHHPILGPAARFLQEYKDLINSNSDGWCYWRYGTKCADSLCGILHNASQAKYESMPVEQATEAQVKAACKKITLFIRRCKQTKDKIQPPTLVMV